MYGEDRRPRPFTQRSSSECRPLHPRSFGGGQRRQDTFYLRFHLLHRSAGIPITARSDVNR